MNFDDYISGGIALFAGFASWFLGGLDGLMTLLVVFVVLDYVTGLMKGFLTHSLSSETGFHGIAKKVCIFMLVGIANIIDNELLGRTEVLRDAVTMFYIAYEGLSITENAIEIGLPVPEAIKQRFAEWNETHKGALNAGSSPQEAGSEKSGQVYNDLYTDARADDFFSN